MSSPITDVFRTPDAMLGLIESMIKAPDPLITQIAVRLNEDGLWEMSYPNFTRPFDKKRG